MNLAAAAEDVMNLIKSTGIKNVAMDARKLQLPGVLVMPSTIEVDRLDDRHGTIVWEAYAIAGDQGPMEALIKLGRMMDRLKNITTDGEFEHTSLTLINQNQGGLPALRFTVTTEVSGD